MKTFTSRVVTAALVWAALGSSACMRLSLSIPESAFDTSKSETIQPETLAKKPEPPARTPAQELTGAMTEELQLQPEQQTRVYAILRTTADKVKAARLLYPDDRTTLNKTLLRVNADAERDLQRVLSTVQYQQYILRRRQLQARMQTKTPPPTAPATPAAAAAAPPTMQ